MSDIELVIKIDDETYKEVMDRTEFDTLSLGIKLIETVQNGIPLEEIPNPCIECSQNCCVCELNGEKCECQKVYVVKESKE